MGKMPRHKKKRIGDQLDPNYGMPNPWMYNPFMAAAAMRPPGAMGV